MKLERREVAPAQARLFPQRTQPKLHTVDFPTSGAMPLRNSRLSFCNQLGRFWFELLCPLDMDYTETMRTLHDFAAPNVTAPSVKLILYFVLIVMLRNSEVSAVVVVAAVDDPVQRDNFVWADDYWGILSTIVETIDLAIILNSFDYSNSTSDTFVVRAVPSKANVPRPEVADVPSPSVLSPSPVAWGASSVAQEKCPTTTSCVARKTFHPDPCGRE